MHPFQQGQLWHGRWVRLLPFWWASHVQKFGQAWEAKSTRDGSLRALMNMDVSENSGTPKSSILIGFSNTNYLFWGTPIFGNTQISFYYLFLQQSEVEHNFSFSENQFGRRVNLHGCCLETPMFLLFFSHGRKPTGEFKLDIFVGCFFSFNNWGARSTSSRTTTSHSSFTSAHSAWWCTRNPCNAGRNGTQP